MEHKGSVELITDRLLLRRFELKDAEPMFNNWAHDPEVTRFLTWLPHDSVGATKQIIQSWLDNYNEPDFYQWAFCLKSEPDNPFGSISAFSLNKKINSVELGYCIGQAWWGNGYVAEASLAIVEFLFEEVGVNKIIARHAVENPNSGRVLQKAGFQKEGLFRQADTDNQGKLIDMVYYGKLASDCVL